MGTGFPCFTLAHSTGKRSRTLVDGPTTVPGAKGIREGIVIRPLKERHVRGLGRLILKVVSNAYLEKDNK